MPREPVTNDPGGSRRDKRRDAMLDAALQLFLARGYGTTTLGEVVRISGRSLSTLYALFESKEGLFRAVVERQCGLIAGSLAAVETPDRPPAQVLRAFAELILDVALDPANVALMRQVIAETPQFPELGRTVFASGVEVILARITDYLGRQTRLGALVIDDVATAATVFAELVVQQFRFRLLCGVPVDLTPESRASHLDRATAIFFRAFGPATPRP